MKTKIVLFLVVCYWHSTIHTGGIKLAFFGATIGATSLYFLYQKFRVPGKFEPTVANLNTVTLRPVSYSPKETTDLRTLVKKVKTKKLPAISHTIIKEQLYAVHNGVATNSQDDYVFVFVRGYAKKDGPSIHAQKQFYDLLKTGGGMQSAYIQYHDGIVPFPHPVISFDLPDDQKNFAFGQEKEIKSLQCIYDEIVRQNNTAGIVLIGDCRGGKVVLDWLTQKPDHIKALVLMCPFISGKELSDTLAHNHLAQWPPFSYLSQGQCQKFLYSWFFQNYYPSYKPENDDLYERLGNIDAKLPILIAHRDKDQLVRQEVIDKIAAILHTNHQPLTIYRTHDTSAAHSKLTHLPDVQKEIHQFYHTHGLPYNQQIIHSC